MEIGDNSRAADPADLAADAIEAKLAGRMARREELIASASRVAVTDEDSTGRAASLLSMMRALEDAVEFEAGEVRQPYDHASDVVKNRAAKFLAPLYVAVTSVRTKVDTYRTEERQRVQDQADEQARIEDQLRAKRAAEIEPANIPDKLPDAPAKSGRYRAPPPETVAKPVTLPAVRGDTGGRISDRLVDQFEIIDAKKLPKMILDHPKVVEAFIIAARDLYKLQKNIPGVKVTKGVSTTARK